MKLNNLADSYPGFSLIQDCSKNEERNLGRVNHSAPLKVSIGGS
ncbi:hypothetical protein LYNGBM3L_20190 [Moorena producens 3L]|uniref:Uncharacterized protein n=1 Tax=Moorena producens 3L TaxID=489825 RepID=F4XML0_9CYAN|nr:hypothetical protein LYNGBM3L_20190 [Moorena producens 3L]